jgi:nucleotide-binding universal stress UspA family protein
MIVRRILVATDFSAAAELAVQRAAALAQSYGAELRLLHAVPPLGWLEGLLGSKQQWREQVRARAASTLKDQAAQLANERQIEVSTALHTGKASAAIADAAEQFDPQLMVVGASGEGQARVKNKTLGQTASKLIGKAQVPLLLTRRAGRDLPSKVLAAVDLTPSSVRVARWADTIASDGQSYFIHVFEAPFAPRLRKYGVKPGALDIYAADEQATRKRKLRNLLAQSGARRRSEKLILRGDAVKIITAQVRKLKIDTLIVGKHGRRKRDAAAPYGSVCYYLTQFAPVDTLVVP